MERVRFGKYVLGPRLARGGMAELYQATALGPQGFAKPVVIKRLLPHLAERRELVALFLAEARLAAQLHHPNIVQIYDLGRDGDAYFICMEHLDGEDLAALVNRARSVGQRVPLEAVAKISACVAEGLQFAHARRRPEGAVRAIVHGDISPSNVVVTFVGEVKIVDFGVARTAGRIERVLPGTLKGKLSYLAPEQVTTGSVDPRADLFALGVVMHELATGERLFRRDTEAETLRALIEEPIPDPRERRPELPPELAALILRALERDPARRFQSAEELRVALEAFLASRPYLPTTSYLSGYLRSLFGEAHLVARQASLERCISSTVALSGSLEAPAVDPARAPVVPLTAEVPPARPSRTWSRNGWVRVAGEVPAALLRAGYTMVAVPATMAAFALRWPLRRLRAVGVVLCLAGFGAGLTAREIHDAAFAQASSSGSGTGGAGVAGSSPTEAVRGRPEAATKRRRTRGPRSKKRSAGEKKQHPSSPGASSPHRDQAPRERGR